MTKYVIWVNGVYVKHTMSSNKYPLTPNLAEAKLFSRKVDAVRRMGWVLADFRGYYWISDPISHANQMKYHCPQFYIYELDQGVTAEVQEITLKE